jgi:hypothetical protein
MSLTAQIGSSEVTFKLSQKIVSALAEKFSFKFEDGWSTVSTRTLENIQKRLKREKRRTNPTSSIKHPRTAFSFFTQKQRPVSQAAHPEATFGQLSRFVSEAWKALTPEKMAEFKALETVDKERYQVERAAVLANLAANPVAVVAAEAVADEPETAPVKKTKAPKTPKAVEATPVAAAPVAEATPAKATKAKTPKVKAETAAPVAAPVEAVVETAKPASAKKAKAPKTAETTATPAPVVEATPVAEAKPAKVASAKVASAKPKAVKA